MRSTTWDAADLEHVLETTGSYTKAAQHYGLSRQRIHIVAQTLLGPDRCKELIAGSHHKHTACLECGDLFNEANPHRANGLCAPCQRRVAYRARKQRAVEKDHYDADVAFRALKYSIGMR